MRGNRNGALQVVMFLCSDYSLSLSFIWEVGTNETGYYYMSCRCTRNFKCFRRWFPCAERDSLGSASSMERVCGRWSMFPLARSKTVRIRAVSPTVGGFLLDVFYRTCPMAVPRYFQYGIFTSPLFRSLILLHHI